MTQATNIIYQGILGQVQHHDNNVDSDSETEESEPTTSSIKCKRALDMLSLDKHLIRLH